LDSSFKQIATADFDGDGLPDIAAVSSNGDVYIIRNRMPQAKARTNNVRAEIDTNYKFP
jgi:hypothetical protein